MQLKKFIKILRTSEFKIPTIYSVQLKKQYNQLYNYDRGIIQSSGEFKFLSKKNFFGYQYFIEGKVNLEFNTNYRYYNSCEIYGYHICLTKKFYKLVKEFRPTEKGIIIMDFINLVESEIMKRLTKYSLLNDQLNITLHYFIKNHEGDLDEKIYPR